MKTLKKFRKIVSERKTGSSLQFLCYCAADYAGLGIRIVQRFYCHTYGNFQSVFRIRIHWIRIRIQVFCRTWIQRILPVAEYHRTNPDPNPDQDLLWKKFVKKIYNCEIFLFKNRHTVYLYVVLDPPKKDVHTLSLNMDFLPFFGGQCRPSCSHCSHHFLFFIYSIANFTCGTTGT